MILRMLRTTRRGSVLFWLLVVAGTRLTAGAEINQVAGSMLTFNTNGSWCWYQDERVIVDTKAGKLLMSSVASPSGMDGAARDGDIDVVSCDLASGQTNRFVLHAGLGSDAMQPHL